MVKGRDTESTVIVVGEGRDTEVGWAEDRKTAAVGRHKNVKQKPQPLRAEREV